MFSKRYLTYLVNYITFLPMLSQVAFQKFLQCRFEEARRKNPAYSLRAFALKLGTAAGPLSQILKGKRRVSEQKANLILDRLEIPLADRTQVMARLSAPRESLPDTSGQLLAEDQFKLISDWFHYAILSLLHVKDFKNRPSWIAGRLGISENQVQDAIARMKRLGMIEETPQRKLRRRSPQYRTTDNVPSSALKRAHEQTLQLAQKALHEIPVGQRDFIHITVPTSPEQLQKAKVYLRNAQDELCAILMDTTEKTEVYRLSFELFPLTRFATETVK
jgi:transcriptional regulator with XRE-family HTH domain